MSRTCVFIDGGYFQKVQERDFSRQPVDFGRIGPALASGYEPYLRTYYYNCPPYQSNPPTPDEQERTRKSDRFYYALKRIPNLEIRLGRLEFRGWSRETNERIFIQKRVDVQLVVDLLTLALTRQIATAVVVTGDSDFIPAFETAKNHGVRIVVCHGVQNPAHKDLLAKADERKELNAAFAKDVALP